MKLLCSLLLGFNFVLSSTPNDFAEQLRVVLDLEDRIARVHGLEKLKAENETGDAINLATVHHQLGIDYRKLGEYQRALENALVAVQMRESLREVKIQDLDLSLYNLYSIYKKINDPNSAVEILHRLVNTGHNTNFSLDASIKLSLHFTRQGSYFKAIEHLDKIISGYHQHKNDRYLERAHRTKIAVFAEMGLQDTTVLKDVLYHVSEVEKTIENYPSSTVGFYNNLGIIYRTFGQQKKALFYYRKALDNTHRDTSHENVLTLYLNIGEMYAQLNQSVKAKEFFERVLKLGDSINVSAVYNNLGFYYANTVTEEIEYHKKAIKLLGIEGGLSDDANFLLRVRNFPYRQELLSYLIDLSGAWVRLYEQSHDKSYLQEALPVFYAIDNLISVMRLDSSTKRSKLFWIKRGVNSYVDAVEVCYLLGRSGEAFYFMEKNKSLYLLEQLGKLQLRNRYKIPKELLEREFDLKYHLLSLKSALRKSPENVSFHNEFNVVWQEYTQLVDSLKKMFPDYYRSDLESKIVTFDEFGTFLNQKNTSAIEYILGESQGYGLWTNGQDTHFFKLENYADLVENIAFLKQLFVMPMLSRDAALSYQEKALGAFKVLFSWEGAVEQLSEGKVVIIPDGGLHNLPFEALLTADTSVLKDGYFINLAEISYLNSASVFQRLNASVSLSKNSYLGMAPVVFKFEGMTELRNSEQLIKEVAALFPSDVKLKEEANKEVFLTSSGAYNLLHLNTHAGIDSITNKPWLALYDTLIYLEDVFKMSYKSNLVILDACKTGNGNWQEGEGVESLSKAFFHAGTQSVIASQWNANEIATNTILLSFFKALKDGKSKSNALRNAKLRYLKNHQLSETFPYFWASLTLTGNPDALSNTSNSSNYWIFSILILIFVALTISIKRSAVSRA